MKTYLKEFAEYNEAWDWMVMKNQACERAGNKSDIYCVVPGPDDDYVVVDLKTAIELGTVYVWSFSHLRPLNPWNA